MRALLFGLLAIGISLPGAACAQEAVFAEPLFEDTVYKAEVISIEEEGNRALEGLTISEDYQIITARLSEGARAGETLTLENDTGITLSVGDTFYAHRLPATDLSPEQWSVGEPDRKGVLIGLFALFILVTVLVAGVPGLRSLVALAASFLVIIYVLVPLLIAGYPPVLTAITLGMGILALSMVITHGFGRSTWIALAGSVAALLVAAGLSQAAVALAKLSGFVSDEAVFLNFATSGTIDLSGLLLGGILVGIIGVLNDVSVSQVHTVMELHAANPALSRRAVWTRAMKVGREHMGAVVNTLPLAYAGVSLPLLLLFSQSDAPFWFIVNREVFAAEVVRALAGSIGLILSGAIATVLAVAFLIPQKVRATISSQP